MPVLNLDQLARYKALAGGSANLVVESAYSYDTAHRLTGMVNTPAAGNGSASYVPGAQNRLDSDGTHTYAYDNQGRLTEKRVTATGVVVERYNWDQRDRFDALAIEFRQLTLDVGRQVPTRVRTTRAIAVLPEVLEQFRFQTTYRGGVHAGFSWVGSRSSYSNRTPVSPITPPPPTPT
ncbi:MAG: hypothetical protein K1X71_02865 [Pirellulales bacterium]|nr:hypothetical protein [Pirellulales bacterium]